jgi:site-specific DNA recombinase
MASVDTRAIEGEVDRIRSLGLEDLRREWRRLNHGEPPRISRDLLVLALGYRLQEVAHGGLGKATRRKLLTMAKALRATGRVGPAPSLSLKPGARLVREWGGRMHTVTVTEVSGERIRDKIAASKKRGMWMGGMPPLGFDVKNHKLVVNDAEARIVIDIYRRYLALRSVHVLRDELADAGIKSKRRMRPDGAEYGGQKFSRGALYLILQNRLYRGEIPHKGKSYPGEHPAIVDKPLWDDVQAVLAANRVERANGARTSHPSLLTGMVFDEAGERLTPTYAVKKGTRYRYYVSTSLLTGAGRNRSSGRRIPAGNLEGLVINRIRTFLADPGAILDAVDHDSHAGLGRNQLIERGRQIAEELGSQAPDELKALLVALFCRVEIRSDRVDIMLSRDCLTRLLAGSLDFKIQHQAPINEPGDLLRLTVPVGLKRAGREMRMLVENADDQTPADPSLLRIIARAHHIQARLIQNPKLSVHDIAREEQVSAAYLYTLLRLPCLAPDITTAIINGRKPPQLTAQTLMRLTPRLPAGWAEQRKLLGFR